VTAEVRDAMLALARLEARFTILRDPRYTAVWRERAMAVRADLARLRDLARAEDEARHLAEAAAVFERYFEAVVAERHRLAAAGGGGRSSGVWRRRGGARPPPPSRSAARWPSGSRRAWRRCRPPRTPGCCVRRRRLRGWRSARGLA